MHKTIEQSTGKHMRDFRMKRFTQQRLLVVNGKICQASNTLLKLQGQELNDFFQASMVKSHFEKKVILPRNI